MEELSTKGSHLGLKQHEGSLTINTSIQYQKIRLCGALTPPQKPFYDLWRNSNGTFNSLFYVLVFPTELYVHICISKQRLQLN
jgi:hypothetical protein